MKKRNIAIIILATLLILAVILLISCDKFVSGGTGTQAPTVSPTNKPTNVPTKAVTPSPTEEIIPSAEPSVEVTSEATPEVTPTEIPDEPDFGMTDTPSPMPEPTSEQEMTEAPTPSVVTPTATPTVVPTRQETPTPKPTSTPRPTTTPVPTATPTPLPEYVVEVVPEMLDLVNEARDEYGYRHYEWGDAELEEIALKRVFEFRDEFNDSTKEVHDGTVNHYHSGYNSGISEIAAYGDRYYEWAFDTWKGSPGHWASIISDNTEDEIVLPGATVIWDGKKYYEGDVLPGQDIYMVCAHLKHWEGSYYAHYWVIVFAGVQR